MDPWSNPQSGSWSKCSPWSERSTPVDPLARPLTAGSFSCAKALSPGLQAAKAARLSPRLPKLKGQALGSRGYQATKATRSSPRLPKLKGQALSSRGYQAIKPQAAKVTRLPGSQGCQGHMEGRAPGCRASCNKHKGPGPDQPRPAHPSPAQRTSGSSQPAMLLPTSVVSGAPRSGAPCDAGGVQGRQQHAAA